MKDIWDFPPEIIVEILLFCNNEDAVNFAEALSVKNEDIRAVVANKKLWKHVVIPPGIKNFKYLGSFTRSLQIGSENETWSIPKSQMKIIKAKCTALEKLTIVNSRFFISSAPLSMFPQTITHLKFVDVSIDYRRSTENHSSFHKLEGSFPKLKCLELEGRARNALFKIYPIAGNKLRLEMSIKGDGFRVIRKHNTEYEYIGNILLSEFGS